MNMYAGDFDISLPWWCHAVLFASPKTSLNTKNKVLWHWPERTERHISQKGTRLEAKIYKFRTISTQILASSATLQHKWQSYSAEQHKIFKTNYSLSLITASECVATVNSEAGKSSIQYGQ